VVSQPVINNYTDLKPFTAQPHKLNSSAAMYAFEINYNFQMGSRKAIPDIHYLFVIRKPKPTLDSLVSAKLYHPDSVAMYYCYRLRRICEIAKRVSGMLLTYDQIVSGEYIEPLGNYLGLKDRIIHSESEFSHLQAPSYPFDKKVMEWCDDCYERHLFFLKNQPLIRSLSS